MYSNIADADSSEQASVQTVGEDMAQAEAQQAADDFDGTEMVDGRQGSLSSRRPKTPRCDGGQSPGPSPNARSRKMRKSAREKDLEDGP